MDVGMVNAEIIDRQSREQYSISISTARDLLICYERDSFPRL